MSQYSPRGRSRHGSARRAPSRNNYSRSNNRSRGKKMQGDAISIEKYINTKVIANQQSEYEPKHVFADFPFNDQLKSNILTKGYDSPTAIQDQAIPHILGGSDVLGLANTGTGKTAAFVLPIIDMAARSKQYNHTLIITPTRELAEQVNAELFSFTKGMRVFSALCVGGMHMGHQIKSLQRGVHVIIGTPGRLKDLMEKGFLDLSKIEVLVLDEADQMLDMGFLPDMRTIIGKTPRSRQVLCFSATMDDKVAKLIQDIQHEPVEISVLQKQTSEHIFQDVIRIKSKDDKFPSLTSLVGQEEFQKVLVFTETKHGAQRISDTLSKHGIASQAIHGNKNQSQRRRALAMFKNEEVKILVATDVAARGLDIPSVDLVINYDEPKTYDTYVHRIGRTGRAGKNGHARTFINVGSSTN